MCHKDVDPSLQEINNLRLSLAEEAQAIIDYKNRALMSEWATKKLFEHLAKEEAMHFGMLLEMLIDKVPEIEEYLTPVQYLWD